MFKLQRNNRKIVFVVTSFTSARAFLFGILEHLVTIGWEPTLIASLDKAELVEDEIPKGVSFRPIPMARQPQIFADIGSLIRLYALLAKLRPIAVIGATPKAGLVSMIGAYFAKVPIRVYEIWGLRFETEVGVKRKIYKFLERMAVSFSTNVFANSKSLSKEIKKEKIAEEVIVLGDGSSHGVNLEYYDANNQEIIKQVDEIKNKYALNNAELVLAYIGRVHPDKGVELLLRVVRELADEGVGIALLVVGPMEMGNQFIDVDSSPVIYVGHVKDVRPYICSSDALCLLTHREGFPNVIIEAASLGVPSLTTRATGAVDSIVNGETGWLVDVDSADQVREAILFMHKNKSELIRRGDRAKQNVKLRYSHNLLNNLRSQQYENLWNKTFGYNNKS